MSGRKLVAAKWHGLRVVRNVLDDNRRNVPVEGHARLTFTLGTSLRVREVELTSGELVRLAEDSAAAVANLFRSGEL